MVDKTTGEVKRIGYYDLEIQKEVDDKKAEMMKYLGEGDFIMIYNS